MRILENLQMRMQAEEYRTAATHVFASLRAVDVEELLSVARSARAVLADAATSVLWERGLDSPASDAATHARAKQGACELIARLRTAQAS